MQRRSLTLPRHDLTSFQVGEHRGGHSALAASRMIGPESREDSNPATAGRLSALARLSEFQERG